MRVPLCEALILFGNLILFRLEKWDQIYLCGIHNLSLGMY